VEAKRSQPYALCGSRADLHGTRRFLQANDQAWCASRCRAGRSRVDVRIRAGWTPRQLARVEQVGIDPELSGSGRRSDVERGNRDRDPCRHKTQLNVLACKAAAPALVPEVCLRRRRSYPRSPMPSEPTAVRTANRDADSTTRRQRRTHHFPDETPQPRLGAADRRDNPPATATSAQSGYSFGPN